MKKIIFFSLLLAALVLSAQTYPESGFELRLHEWVVLPFNVSGNSHYDYMHGAYDGFPIRVQPSDVPGRGIYMTFMNQATAQQNRRQRLAFASFDGDLQANTELAQGISQEGFGTLAIDKLTGNPFFVWHSNDAPMAVRMVYDGYVYSYSPGINLSEATTILSNTRPPNRPPHPTTPNVEEFTFIWPVVFSGPSPHAGYQRLYVFMSNSGSGWAPASTPAGRIQSSARRLAFADFYYEFDQESPDWYSYVFRQEGQAPIWTIRQIDYFERIHYWLGTGGGNAEATFARMYSSYGVSEDGKVAFAGQMIYPSTITEFVWEKFDMSTLSATNPPSSFPTYPNDGEWPGAPGTPYDHFIVSNSNYGEGDFFIKRLNYERHWDPFYTLDIHNNVGNVIPFSYEVVGGTTVYDMHNFHMEMITMNNKTLAFDAQGRLHVPTTYQLLYLITGEPVETIPPDASRYVFVGCEASYRFVYNFTDHSVRLDRVFPRPATNVGQVTMPFDLDDDGIIDPEFVTYSATGGIRRFFEGTLPYYHYARENRFHNSQMRMSEMNDGLMVKMWIDSYKSWRINGASQPDPDYAPWQNTDELLIQLYDDAVGAWSNPLRISSVTHSEFAGIIPAFIYPADKPLRHNFGGRRAILYFMFTDDVDYGGFSAGDPSFGGPGSYVKMAAIHVQWGVNEIDNPDIPSPKMLTQNYPNPFNPTTNISFEIQRPGVVNLSVYNIKGQLVRTITNEHYNAGKHSVAWHGVDNNNNSVASGVYFYKIEANGQQEIRRMALVK
jgi:hypothetical protein